MKALIVFGLTLMTVCRGEILVRESIMDVGFVLDGSGSVTSDNWLLMLSFVENFARRVNFGQTGTQIGVVSFGNDATIDVKLNDFSNLTAFEEAVRRIPYKDENTNTAAGIRALRTGLFNNQSNGDRPGVLNVAIVLTDGASTWEVNNTIPEATRAKNEGVKIFTIGIGSNIDMDELNGIASDPDEQFVQVVRRFSDLDSLVNVIVNRTWELQRDTLPTTFPSTRSTTPPTITTRKPPLSAELLFLLDSSGSIPYEEWLLTKDFVKRIVGSIDPNVSNVRVAVIEYSTEAFLSIQLGEQNRQEDFAEAVDRMPYLNQRTNVSGAIRLGYREVFSVKNARPDARKVMVMITDGEFNTDAHLTEGEAKVTRSAGIKLFTVALGKKISIDQLKAIASKPYYYFIRVINDFPDLLNYWNNVATDVLRDEYPEETMMPSFQDCAADIIFLIDVSPSEYGDVMSAAVTAYDLLVNSTISPHTSWLTKTSQSEYEDGIEIIGNDLGQSFQYIRNVSLNETDRLTAQKVVFVITNGLGSDVNLLKSETNALKDDGVKFFTVVIGTGSKEEFLREIASDPKTSTFLAVRSASELRRLMNSYRDTGSSSLPFVMDICKMSSPVMWNCSFEVFGRCGIQDDPDADFTWTITSGPTPSRHTGPNSAFSGSYYAFIEASYPRKEGDIAVMHLPFSAAGTFCLTFYYHMFGFHIGVLDVLILTNDREDIIWRMSGDKGEEWHYGQALLRLQEGDRVAIRAIRAENFSGDIGLDLLQIQRSPCVGDI